MRERQCRFDDDAETADVYCKWYDAAAERVDPEGNSDDPSSRSQPHDFCI